MTCAILSALQLPVETCAQTRSTSSITVTWTEYISKCIGIEKRAPKVLLNPGVLDSDNMLEACFPFSGEAAKELCKSRVWAEATIAAGGYGQGPWPQWPVLRQNAERHAGLPRFEFPFRMAGEDPIQNLGGDC